METDTGFVLDWKTHYQQFTTAFRELYSTSHLTDITLCVEGKNIKAHRLILAICSKYFENICKDYIQSKDLVIVMTDVRYEIMVSILKFVYYGEVQLKKEDLPDFVQTATRLKIATFVDDTVKEKAVEEIEEITPKIDVQETKVPKLNHVRKVAPSNPKKRKAVPVLNPTKNVKKIKRPVKVAAKKPVPKDESYLNAEVNPNNQCPICGQNEPTMEQLKLHVKGHDGSGQDGNMCVICRSSMRSSEMLQIHLIHHKLPTVCIGCRTTINTKTGLMNHLQKRHNFRNIKKYFKATTLL